MVVHKNVRSTVEKPKMYHDEYHVYVVKGQHKVEENIGEENEFIGYEVAEELQYDKDEFIDELAAGNISLDTRATALEDMILELSEAVYA